MVSSEIHYNRHAILRLRQEYIPKEFVEAVLHNPDTKLQSKNRGKNKWRKRFGKKWLYVIFRRKNNKIIVVTEFWG